jgi:aspartyl-tRNA(Asn)/glutamyl-tRNA(Gln) amidotransferase subunit A
MPDRPRPSLHDVATAASGRNALEEARRRHAALHDQLHAYAAWGGEVGPEARPPTTDARRGKLSGVPVSIKDCIGVEGFPTFAGTQRRLPALWEREGSVVRTIRRQGGVVVGKTVQTEFALGATGVNPYGPQARNPWDAGSVRSAGGSSTGAGLSLLEGSALLAFGTDTLGSVRIPASVTGTVGFKPGVGRWQTDGVVPLSPTLDTIGYLANDVADAAYAFAAVDPLWQDRDDFVERFGAPRLREVRIGIPESVWTGCEDAIVSACQGALDELAADGATLTSTDFPESADAFRFVQEGTVAIAEFDAFLERALPEWRRLLQPGTAALAERGSRATARQYLFDLDRHRAMSARAADRFRGIDVLAWPTLPLTPPVLDRLGSDGERRRYHLGMLRNTCMASCLRLCSITIPVALDGQGIPVGLEFTAGHGNEERLLSIALAIERCIGTARDRLGAPPLLASGVPVVGDRA